MTRAGLIAEALEWRGTPWHHRASVKGAGCDCVGLIAGLWRHFAGPEPWQLPAYGPDWTKPGPELLLDLLAAHFVPVPIAALRAGDILAFRLAPDAPCAHVALFLGPERGGGTHDPARILHAYWARAVVESRYAPAWCRRAEAAFAFPFLPDLFPPPEARP